MEFRVQGLGPRAASLRLEAYGLLPGSYKTPRPTHTVGAYIIPNTILGLLLL